MDNRGSFGKNNIVLSRANNMSNRSAFNNIMKNHRLQEEKGQKTIAIVLICIIVFIIVSLLVYFLMYKRDSNDETKDKIDNKTPKCVEACNMCKRRKYTHCEGLCESCKAKIAKSKK